MTQYIAYYRVSTKKQDTSGLGIEAQEKAVADFLTSKGGELLESVKEVESGAKSDRERPELAKAIALCKKHKATLLVARLDRLSRSVAFTASLTNRDLKFVCCDMPDVNDTTIYIWAIFNQNALERIQANTKAALEAAKARGVVLGNKDIIKIGVKGRVQNSDKAQAHAENVYPIIQRIRKSGITSMRGIAAELNLRNDISTRQTKELGLKRIEKKFKAQTVINIINRVELKAA